MKKQKYLYGAAVQGIQSFIFQTNELKDIVGASELVSYICGKLFADLLYGIEEDTVAKLDKDANSILNAAGNIKYVFDNYDECARVVREFPKKVVESAPGVTISQAVVEVKESMSFSDSVQLLEEKLRSQKNKQMRSILLGMTGIRRSRSTGLPAIFSDDKKNLFQDKATLCKKEADRKVKHSKLCYDAFGEYSNQYKYPYDLSDITDENKWIAVIHADGNGLGQVVQKIGDNPAVFKQFSKTLDIVTKLSAQNAFKYIEEKELLKPGDVVPIRPIVLGGDDLTVICRGNLAMDYVKVFMQEFKKLSEEMLGGIIREYNKLHRNNLIFSTGETYLTACAGVAYIKVNYPFYYGYELAESLCSYAKKIAKSDNKVTEMNGLPSSCVMFHKVQDSFVESYDDIKRRELQPSEERSFQFGPYFLSGEVMEGYWSIDELIKNKVYLESNDREKNFIKSAVRNWLTNVHDSFEMATQIINNTKRIACKSDKDFIDRIIAPQKRIDGAMYYPAFDVLSLLSVSQKIKTRK